MKNILLVISLLSIGILTSTMVFGQNMTNTTTMLETNSTNTTSIDNELPVPNLIIGADLIKDTDAFSFQGGEIYKIMHRMEFLPI